MRKGSLQAGQHVADHLWERVLTDLDLDGARLLEQSKYDKGRRAYVKTGRLYKVVCNRMEQTRELRLRSLEEESQILEKLQDDPAVPQNPVYSRTHDAECLSYDFIPGSMLSRVNLTVREKAKVALRLARIVARLSMRGVVHNDLLTRNVVIAEEGKVALLDFDQAAEVSRGKAWLTNFTKITLGAKKPHGAFPTIMKQLIKDTLPEPVVQNIARVRNTLRYSIGANRTPRISKTASPKLHKLREAWSIARKSDASAPGVPLCYYEITEDGYRFPGERPWDERWAVLRGITPLRGKRILELGCNLSLLSCFALKEEGAENALCVDVDSKILAAAQLIADAYGVTPLYKRVDFDSGQPWEKELLAFKPDVVTALSVLNWVRDKERFLQFLANFKEVIFEGHEPFEVEKARFLQVGFTRIREVSVSERARPIMLCQK